MTEIKTYLNWNDDFVLYVIYFVRTKTHEIDLYGAVSILRFTRRICILHPPHCPSTASAISIWSISTPLISLQILGTPFLYIYKISSSKILKSISLRYYSCFNFGLPRNSMFSTRKSVVCLVPEKMKKIEFSIWCLLAQLGDDTY